MAADVFPTQGERERGSVEMFERVNSRNYCA